MTDDLLDHYARELKHLRSAAAEFAAADIQYECPRCHRPSGQLRQGREMELAALEIS